jgi:superfamily II DNA/RNA helicase
MVFVRTRQDSENLSLFLRERGIGAISFHGEKGTEERQRALAAFAAAPAFLPASAPLSPFLSLPPSAPLSDVLAASASLSLSPPQLTSLSLSPRVLVATDAAARGIDTPPFPLVISASLPLSPSLYVHRAGRVGRGDTSASLSLSLSLVSPSPELSWFHRCKKAGKGCEDVKGCTVRLRERESWREIGERLGETVLSVDPTTLSLSLSGFGRKREREREREREGVGKVRAHLSRTVGEAKVLAVRERELQRVFLTRLYRSD